MATEIKEYLKTKFETGDKPTQQDFTDLIDALPSGNAPNGFVLISPTGSGDYLTLNEAVSAGKYKLYLDEGTHTLTDNIIFDADEMNASTPIVICGGNTQKTKLDFSDYSFLFLDSDIINFPDGVPYITTGTDYIYFEWEDSIEMYDAFNALAAESDLMEYYILLNGSESVPSQIKSVELSGNSILSGNAIIYCQSGYLGEKFTNANGVNTLLSEPFTNFNMHNLTIQQTLTDYPQYDCITYEDYSSILINATFKNIDLDFHDDGFGVGRFVYDYVGLRWLITNVNQLHNGDPFYLAPMTIVLNSTLCRINVADGVIFTNCILTDVINLYTNTEYNNCRFTYYTTDDLLIESTTNKYINCVDANSNLFESYTLNTPFNELLDSNNNTPIFPYHFFNLNSEDSGAIQSCNGQLWGWNNDYFMIDRSQCIIIDSHLVDPTTKAPYVVNNGNTITILSDMFLKKLTYAGHTPFDAFNDIVTFNEILSYNIIKGEIYLTIMTSGGEYHNNAYGYYNNYNQLQIPNIYTDILQSAQKIIISSIAITSYTAGMTGVPPDLSTLGGMIEVAVRIKPTVPLINIPKAINF
jgi:hypothetical protein